MSDPSVPIRSCSQDRVSRQGSSGSTTERLLQEAKVRPPFGVYNDSLTINDGGCDGQLKRRGRDRGKAMCPIVTAAGEDPDFAGLDVDGDAKAVPFYFEKSIVALWRSGLEKGQPGLDPLWHRIEKQVWQRWIAPAPWA